MPKVILISQFPLPYSKIGSWTTMYRNYLESAESQIDYIICEEPHKKFSGVEYRIVTNRLVDQIRRKMHYYRIGFVDQLRALLDKNGKYIIQLVDNWHLADRIHQMLVDHGVRKRCHVQLFYHGYAPFTRSIGEKSHENIDEIILLTHDSYKAHLKHYPVFPFKVSVLYNGIDTGRFCQVTEEQRQQIKLELGCGNKKVFLWCSQDRPKKGLKIVLEAWNKIHPKYPDTELLVVGTQKSDQIKGVRFLGQIPNDNLPKYYQAADCYLFPTLCQEGFGLSLIEALNCGCHCIASKQGGVPEVLQYGKLGRLVENPNFPEEWESAIEDFLSGKDKPITIDRPMYTMQEWNDSMNRIIASAKQSIS